MSLKTTLIEAITRVNIERDAEIKRQLEAIAEKLRFQLQTSSENFTPDDFVNAVSKSGEYPLPTVTRYGSYNTLVSTYPELFTLIQFEGNNRKPDSTYISGYMKVLLDNLVDIPYTIRELNSGFIISVNTTQLLNGD